MNDSPDVCSHQSLVYSFGSAEVGQLGNGRTGEHISTGNKTAFDVEYEPSAYFGATYLPSAIFVA